MPNTSKNIFKGKWRITEMEVWDQDFVDLDGPGVFEFKDKDLGNFHFGAVKGDIDYRLSSESKDPQLDFSWVGEDEGDPTNGRGWAKMIGGVLEGRIFFHRGDDSWFKAKRK